MRRMSMNRTAAAIVLCAGLVGCSSEQHRPLGPPVDVHGVLRQTGGPAGASQPGVPGRVKFVMDAGAGDTTEVPTKADGTFTVQLSPGTYQVTGRSPSCNDNKGVCRAGANIVVKPGVASVTVACDRK